VIGTLYYTQFHSDHGDLHTRFVHALDVEPLKERLVLESIPLRDETVFFPIREVFVEEDVLYQVFHRLEGTLLAHYISQRSPLSLDETVWLARGIVNHLLRLYEEGQFTLVHPQNMVLTPGKALRFLYGGRLGMLPKGAGMDLMQLAQNCEMDRLYDSYTLGAMVYRMLTGKNPMAQGLTIPPISTYCSECPSELDELVMRSFSFDLNKRPKIEEFADFLDWFSERRGLSVGGEKHINLNL
jgi:serine/threonine protein kinase